MTLNPFDLTEAVGRVTSSDIYSLVDSPSVAASLKDGYAVVASDISHASILEPVILKLAVTCGRLNGKCSCNRRPRSKGNDKALR